MRRGHRAWVGMVVPALIALTAGTGLCQDMDDLGLGDLLGGGGAGAGQLMGLLGGMGGLGGAAGLSAGAPTVIVSQPALVAHGDYLYLAQDGKIMKFDLATLKLVAEGTYAVPKVTSGITTHQGTSTGPRIIQGPTGQTQGRPPLVPGATPMATP